MTFTGFVMTIPPKHSLMLIHFLSWKISEIKICDKTLYNHDLRVKPQKIIMRPIHIACTQSERGKQLRQGGCVGGHDVAH